MKKSESGVLCRDCTAVLKISAPARLFTQNRGRAKLMQSSGLSFCALGSITNSNIPAHERQGPMRSLAVSRVRNAS
jgi:hypothetical protein